MNKKLKLITAITAVTSALTFSAPGHAEAPSMNYVQFDYLVSGSADPSDLSMLTKNADVAGGYNVAGSFALNDMFFVSGESLTPSLDASDDGGPDMASAADQTFVGAGIQMPVADSMLVYGQAGLARATFVNEAGHGFGFKVGARARLGQVDLGAWYRMMKTSVDDGTDSYDIDPSAFGVDAAISFSPDAPQLVLGYQDGSTDVSSDTLDGSLDYNHFSIGVRKTF